jgi:hypothetical protein
MSDADSQDRHPAWHSPKPRMCGTCALAYLQSAIDNLNSTIHGGIAQLVERQLCKLEVRGSNPLASNSIFDLRFVIVDLIKSSRSTSRGESKIGNRNSKFSGGAAKRACSSVG